MGSAVFLFTTVQGADQDAQYLAEIQARESIQNILITRVLRLIRRTNFELDKAKRLCNPEHLEARDIFLILKSQIEKVSASMDTVIAYHDQNSEEPTDNEVE